MTRPFRLRACEWVLIAHFGFAAVRAAPRACWTWFVVVALFAAAGSAALAFQESRTGRRAFAIARDWFPLPFLLIGYWSVDWFRNGRVTNGFQDSWVVLDRFLLRECGVKAAIEILGPVLPFTLELCYSLLYPLPGLALVFLYLGGRRKDAPLFLLVLLLASFTSDTLMPMFPSTDPRLRFPGEDLPSWLTPTRALNLGLLENLDIRLSVFPSGHVTVGFATAFGILLAWPERKRLGAVSVLIACVVSVAAVYGRYHYVVDVLSGAAVSLAAAGLVAVVNRRPATDRTKLQPAIHGQYHS